MGVRGVRAKPETEHRSGQVRTAAHGCAARGQIALKMARQGWREPNPSPRVSPTRAVVTDHPQKSPAKGGALK